MENGVTQNGVQNGLDDDKGFKLVVNICYHFIVFKIVGCSGIILKRLVDEKIFSTL